jgi:hypothetical protein
MQRPLHDANLTLSSSGFSAFSGAASDLFAATRPRRRKILPKPRIMAFAWRIVLMRENPTVIGSLY